MAILAAGVRSDDSLLGALRMGFRGMRGLLSMCRCRFRAQGRWLFRFGALGGVPQRSPRSQTRIGRSVRGYTLWSVVFKLRLRYFDMVRPVLALITLTADGPWLFWRTPHQSRFLHSRESPVGN